jgi:hypothetical protein
MRRDGGSAHIAELRKRTAPEWIGRRRFDVFGSEHDPEKHALGLDPMGGSWFPFN